jgi:hypothetical protein
MKTVNCKKILLSNVPYMHLDAYAHKLHKPSSHPLHLPKYQNALSKQDDTKVFILLFYIVKTKTVRL